MRPLIWLSKKLFKLFLVYVILVGVLVGVLFLAPDVWSPPLVKRLEQQIKLKTGASVKIKGIRFVGLWPVTLSLDGIQIGVGLPIGGAIKAVEVAYSQSIIDGNWLRPRIHFALTVIEPEILILPGPEEAKTNEKKEDEISRFEVLAQVNPNQIKRPTGFDLNPRISVRGGVVRPTGESPLWEIKNFDGGFEILSLRAAQWEFRLKGKGNVGTSVGGSALVLPFSFDFGRTRTEQDSLNIEGAFFNLGNLRFVGGGKHYWSGQDSFLFPLEKTDLEKLPLALLPPGKWKGGFSGRLSYERRPMEAPQVGFQVDSESVSGQIEVNKNGLVASGDMNLRLRIRAQYDGKLIVDDSSVGVDLTQVEIKFDPWFKKLKGTDFLIDVVADAKNERFYLRRGLVRFAQLRLDGSGEGGYSLADPFQGRLNLAPTNLMGIERFFPSLEKFPLSGVVSSQVSARGSMSELQNLEVKIDQLILNGVSGNIDYEKDGLHVKGPFRMQAQVIGLFKGLDLKSVGWNMTGDFTNTAIQYGDLVRKPAPWNLLISSSGRILDDQIMIETARLASAGGDFFFNGGFSKGEKKSVKMNARLSPLKVNPWLNVVKIPHLSAGGQIVGQLNLGGSWIPKEGIASSPLQVSGRLSWDDGNLVYRPPKVDKNASEPGQAEVTRPIEPLLPNWPIIRTAELEVTTNLKALQFGDLVLERVQHSGQWVNGQWRSTIKIGNVWGGQVDAPKLVLSPSIAPPSIEIEATAKQIQAGLLLRWINPALKDYLFGQVDGKFVALGALPLGEIGFSQIKVDGKAQVQKGVLRSVPIDQMINRELGRVGINSKANGGAFLFNAQTVFQFLDSQLSFKSFALQSNRNDELRMSGIVRPNLEGDFTGSAALSSLRIAGSIAQANQDAKGRLVVPFQMKGNLMKPNFSLADATIGKMVKNVVEAEANKAIEKAKEQVSKKVGQDVEKKVEEGKGQLQKELNKRLKGILGR